MHFTSWDWKKEEANPVLHKFAHMKKVTQLGGDENVVMESHIHY
jgi:hypothetical protein